MKRLATTLVFALFTLALAACGADAGVRTVSADQAFETISESPPENLVVLDIRTPDEFAGAHLSDATLIDFYEPDFADRITDLDRDATYVMYCRSGNRSAQALETMADLGFSDVREIDGGITSWLEGGHPVVTSGG